MKVFINRLVFIFGRLLDLFFNLYLVFKMMEWMITKPGYFLNNLSILDFHKIAYIHMFRDISVFMAMI